MCFLLLLGKKYEKELLKVLVGMLSTVNRIRSILRLIRDKNIIYDCRVSKKDFTRNSPLNFENLLLLLLNDNGLTRYMEIRRFFKKIKEFTVSKAAFSKGRLKLKPDAFKILKNKHLSEFYSTNEVKKFKGHIILCGDGSKCILPSITYLKKIFGGIKNKFGKITTVAMNTTMIYDCLNKFSIEFDLDKYEVSEKELIKRNMKNIRKLDYLKDEKKIFLFDRGFPSIEFFIDLLENNEKFLFRIKKIAYKTEKMTMNSSDEFIDILITKARMNHIKDLKLKEKLLKMEKINLRVTKITLPNGEEEHLISNLDKETFTYNDLKDLYNLRWGIEVSFDTLKNLLQIEKVSGYSEIAVKQDYFSQILAYNIATDIENTAQKKLEEKQKLNNEMNKINKKINKNLIIGIIKDDLIEISIIKEEEIQIKMLKNIIEEVSRLYTQPSTKKSKRREKKPYPAKIRSNNSRSF